MASLRGFARQIRNQGRQIEVKANELKIRTAIAINTNLIFSTPVDTGQARGGWQLSIGSPITSPTSRRDKHGGATAAANSSRALTAKPTAVIFITNNVEHIEPLNDGSSAQAPAGFVEAAVLLGERTVRGASLI